MGSAPALDSSPPMRSSRFPAATFSSPTSGLPALPYFGLAVALARQAEQAAAKPKRARKPDAAAETTTETEETEE